MSDSQSIVTVPDAQTAALLREVLLDGGIEHVEVRAVTGLAYMPRANALDYEVRVAREDVARATLVLADYEEESGAAAVRQSSDVEVVDAEAPAEPLGRRKPWVLWVAVGAAIVLLAPIVLSALMVAAHFIRELVF